MKTPFTSALALAMVALPGKDGFVIMIMRGPQQPWFDMTWRPGEIEPVK